MENFTPLVNLLLKKGGARQVADFAELASASIALMQDTAMASTMAQKGYAALKAHEGATLRSVARLVGPTAKA